MVLVVSGCGAEARVGELQSRLALAASPSCPNYDPYPLPFVLNSPQDQAELGDDLAFCTNGTETIVSNNSESVWIVTSPPGLTWQGMAPTSAAMVFETAADRLRSGPGLALGPGMAAGIPAAPDQVQVQLDLSYLSMWQASKIAGDAFDKKGQGSAKALFGQKSPMLGAAASCAVGSYLASRSILTAEPPDNQDFASWVASTLGLTNSAAKPVTTCVKDWRAAEDEVRRSNLPVVAVEELEESASEPAWRTVANDAYSLLRRVGTSVARVAHA